MEEEEHYWQGFQKLRLEQSERHSSGKHDWRIVADVDHKVGVERQRFVAEDCNFAVGPNTLEILAKPFAMRLC